MAENDRPTTRRALLLAAAGGAAAVAAHATLPAAALAHDADDVLLGGPNSESTETSIGSSSVDENAFSASVVDGTGAGVAGNSSAGPGVRAHSDQIAGVYAIGGDGSGAAAEVDTPATGVYGYTPATPEDVDYLGTAVWGNSPDIGVYGSGGYGVAGSGDTGVRGDGFRGVDGRGYDSGGIGVLGTAVQPGTTAVYADAGTSVDRLALRVKGKAVFSRSGRTPMSAGQSSKAVSLAGVTSSSLVFAQLLTNRPGRWVRAVTPTTGRFTIYLNTSLNYSAYVVWWVLN
jgi:hypothetical protein